MEADPCLAMNPPAKQTANACYLGNNEPRPRRN